MHTPHTKQRSDDAKIQKKRARKGTDKYYTEERRARGHRKSFSRFGNLVIQPSPVHPTLLLLGESEPRNLILGGLLPSAYTHSRLIKH